MESTTSPPRGIPGSVYRYYDSDDVLIYVGVTKRGVTRNLEHASSREWWPFVVRQEVEHFETYEAARAEERRQIFANHPPFNRQHNPWYADVHAAYLAHRARIAVPTQDFGEVYRSVKRSLPLLVVGEPSPNDELTLASHPEHWPVARALALPRQVWIRPSGGGQTLGFITSLARSGGVVLLRGHLKKGCTSIRGPVAKIRIVTLKQPEVVRVTGVEVVAAHHV